MGGWEGKGWAGGGGWTSRRRVLLAIRAPTVVLCPQQVTDMCTTHRMGRDGHCQQFDTTPTLISAPQWPHRPCNVPIRLYRVSKKPSVNTDLAMYSHTVDVSRQCMRVSLILGCKLDFSSCAIRAGFWNPVTFSHASISPHNYNACAKLAWKLHVTFEKLMHIIQALLMILYT